jgi:hypothetical protein
MDKPHKQVVTTYPVAVKNSQSRLHVPDPIPWHSRCEYVKCPKCETVYIVDVEFPRVQLLSALEKHHADKQEHPDHIPSAPEWTRVENCDCRW